MSMLDPMGAALGLILVLAVFALPIGEAMICGTIL